MDASLFAPALTTLLGASGTISDIKSKGRAAVANIESSGRSLNFSLRQKSAQLDELGRVLGDKLSASGLEAMKTEARLKAASAETGATASSEVVNQAAVAKLHEDAATLRAYDVNKNSLKISMVADMLSFDNQADSMRSGMTDAMGGFLQGAAGALGGFNTGLNYLNESQKEDFFETNTTGGK